MLQKTITLYWKTIELTSIWKLNCEIENAYMGAFGLRLNYGNLLSLVCVLMSLVTLVHFIHCQLIVLIKEIDKLRELKLQISLTFCKMAQHIHRQHI